MPLTQRSPWFWLQIDEIKSGPIFLALFFLFCFMLDLECRFLSTSIICCCSEHCSCLEFSNLAESIILFPKMAFIHNINIAWAFWVIGLQVYHLLPPWFIYFEIINEYKKITSMYGYAPCGYLLSDQTMVSETLNLK